MRKSESRAGGSLIRRADPMSLDQWMGWGRRVCRAMTQLAVIVYIAILMNSTMVRFSIAQTAGLPQPQFTLLDNNSVDLLSANVYLHKRLISIGSASHPLIDTLISAQDGSWIGSCVPEFSPINACNTSTLDSYTGTVVIQQGSTGSPYAVVYFGSSSEVFIQQSSSPVTYAPVAPSGDTLAPAGSGYTYTKSDGTQIDFVSNSSGQIVPSEIAYPDGRVLTISGTYTPNVVARSDGLELIYTYGTVNITTQSTYKVNVVVPTSITAVNCAYDHCTGSLSSLTLTWPTVNLSWTVPSAGGVVLAITDPEGRETRYTENPVGAGGFGDWTVGIKTPSSASADNISYTYCTQNCTTETAEFVTKVTRGTGTDVGTWNYTETLPTQAPWYTTIYCTNPTAGKWQALLWYVQSTPVYSTDYNPSNHIMDPLISLTNRQGEVFNASSDGFEIVSAVKLENNQNQYTWDARKNLTQVTEVPKPGSPLSSVTLAASYDTTCSNPLTCNQPNWTKDGNGNETDYTYNPNNGRLATVTLPPDANGVRPQINYTYVQRYAWILNSSGGYVEETTPIWVLSTESYCRTSAATSGGGCTATNDQVVKTFYYGPDSGPNNLLLRGVSVTANGQTRVTCYGYDRFGNRISVTTPNAGLSLTGCDQFTAS